MWAYEIKHDGFRFVCRRAGKRRGGYSMPRVVECKRTMTRRPLTSSILSGQVVIDTSTMTYATKLEVAKQLERHAFIDAAVSGMEARAAKAHSR
jgi:hypothetical protein